MDYITTKEAGRLLGCTSAWIVKLLNQKRLAGHKITNRQWLVSKKSVTEYKRQKEIQKHQKKLIK